jgi:flagellar L-ring protein precursor FlgH
VSLFSDDKAHRVGDILTIVINENATAASQAATKNSKNENLSYGPGTGPTAINLGPIHFGLGNIPAFGLGGTIGSTASGSTSRSDNLSAQIEVVVKQILPNGNLVVEGTRQVGMNAETQTITLTGVVRPEDIAGNNTVQSPQVADAEIKYGGKGPVGDKQHDGLISRVFKFLF